MDKIDTDIRIVLSQMRYHHEIQTSNLIDQALALFKLEASLLENKEIEIKSQWETHGKNN